MTTQNDYNEWFKMMLSKHPVKHEYTISSNTHEGIDYLTILITHPNDTEKNIEISTYGRELTLFFWQHHEHHDSFEDDDHEEEFVNLSAYIDDIIDDKVFFAVGYRDDKTVYGEASYEIEDMIDDDVEKVEIKSWSGTHDQTILNKG